MLVFYIGVIGGACKLCLYSAGVGGGGLQITSILHLHGCRMSMYANSASILPIWVWGGGLGVACKVCQYSVGGGWGMPSLPVVCMSAKSASSLYECQVCQYSV